MLVASPHLCRVGGSKVCNITLIMVLQISSFVFYIHARASTADLAFEIVLAEFFLLGNRQQGHLHLVIVIGGDVIDYFSFRDSFKIFQLFKRRQKIC